MADLNVDLAGIPLANPTILASGILGTTSGSLKQAASGGAGAVTIKTITIEPRSGHHNPTLIEVEHGLLNAVGYSNMGLDAALEEFANLKDIGVPVIASVVGETTDEFVEVAKGLSELDFTALEIPLSCPHTPGVGLLAGHGTPEATFDITAAVRDVWDKSLIVKLSPSVTEIGLIAEKAVEAGADILNVGNSLGPGMSINLTAKKPVLDFKFGGYSGPAVRPITIRCIYDVFKATAGAVPIVGCGGITTGLDAIESFMAGASAVGIGSGVYYRGVEVFGLVCDEIEEFMEAGGYSSVKDLLGVAHG
ncbi:MAG TPA: dihydroorotate dehydrogenase [Candidatus Altiarchaeales archaeon]|nr:dihydroorotate dehydrogenase [Candidatus Altiarchaeales archaeon]